MRDFEIKARKRSSYASRFALLGGVSALPMAAVFFTPHAAYATNCPPTVSSSVIGTVDTVNGDDCTITSTGTISGVGVGVDNGTNNVPTLTNHGTILGASALTSQGSIGTLANTGTITGSAFEGIYNIGTIGTVGNAAGLISGKSAGVDNYTDGMIGTLDNAGAITGTSFQGIENNGTIGGIVNTSIISGGFSGIINYSGEFIGTVTNTGTITGTSFYGIGNEGTVGTISNTAGAGAGTIAGADDGVTNFAGATITSLSETGGGLISGNFQGIINTTSAAIGTLSIGTLSSNGGISADTVGGGDTGADNAGGTIFQLSNGGTIQGGTYGIANSPIITDARSNAIVSSDSPQTIQASISTLTNIGSITGGRTGIYNDDSVIGTLTNSGSITGGGFGVLNAGTIGTVANNSGGYISYLENTSIIGGGATAISNAGSIGTLANSGSISGASYGITNTNGGTIGFIANDGTLTATTGAYPARLDAVNNDGLINTLQNYAGGSIIGGNSGINNQYDGTIGTLTNEGVISGVAFYGIQDSGTIASLKNDVGTISGAFGGVSAGNIGALTNSGLITGGDFGVYSSGTIGGLANSGTIRSTSSFTGVYVEHGTVGVLANTGLIAGPFYGVDVAAAMDDLVNAGSITGTVSGLENSGAVEQVLNVTDEAHSGVISGTIGVLNTGFGTIEQFINGFTVFSGGSETIAIATISVDGTPTIANLAGTLGGPDVITGVNTGLSNQAMIGTLTNGGTIEGGFYGITNSYDTSREISGYPIVSAALTGSQNQASITTLTNSASIAGGATGIYNDYGYIGTLGNSGTITGTTIAGIDNTGTIGTLTNTIGGTISGGKYGIFNGNSGPTVTGGGSAGSVILNAPDVLSNSGKFVTSSTETEITPSATIGVISNSGTIIGGTTGVVNDAGFVGTLSNSGTIYGPGAGITNNGGTIGTLTNTGSGTIFGDIVNAGIKNNGIIGSIGNSAAISGYVGINNSSANGADGTIGTLTNSGTISGTGYGVFNANATIGTLNNTGGLISSASLTGIDNLFGAHITILTNSGSISGAHDGIANHDFIGTLSQTGGAITGGSTGVDNDGGAIGTLSNNGAITGTAKIGVANTAGGTIGTLTNLSGGTISGADNETGIFNSATIALLNNSGTVTGALGIANYSSGSSSIASIGLLANSGTIYAPSTGILNYDGTIGTLSNSGAILTARTGIADLGGGTILTLTNSGMVTGIETAIRDEGPVGTIINSGSVSGGSTGVLVSYVALTSLANSGTISGSIGVNNQAGTINTLSQSGGGTIYGGAEGVYNYRYATIGQLTNGLGAPITADTIFGSATGVSNYGGYIGNLANNGTISGGDYGIANSLYQYSFQDAVEVSGLTGNETQGSIATLTNSGSIYGGQTGIYNDIGYIGTLSNHTGATIAGGGTAIDNASGTITTLTNSGTITGTIAGINNSETGSTIGTIINHTAGIIYGGAVAVDAGDFTGIDNAGLITSGNILLQPAVELGNSDIVTNSGTISGGGLFYDGAGSTVTNSGTIAAPGETAVDFFDDATNYLTLTTGTDIVGTIYGSGSPGQITLDGTGNLTAPIADFGTGSALDIDSNGDWTASGTWAIAAVTNDGRFGPGETAEGGVGSTLYLTGNFTQNPDGTLLVAVAPEEESFTTSDFVITGAASLSGAVSFTFAPGTYEAGSHSFLSATDVTGTFTSAYYTNPPSGLTPGVLYPDETDPVLTLSGGGTGIVNVGPTTTSTITTTPTITTAPVTTPTPATPTAPKIVVRPPDTGVFADELQSSANLAQAGNAALLGKAAEGGAAASAVCAAEAGVTPAQTTPQSTTGVEKLTNAVADAFCGAGGWIQASGTAMDVEGDGDIPGYNADTAGFLAGIDAPVGDAGTRLGLAVGYDETFLADSAGGKGQVDTVRAGIFGSQPLGPFMLAGDFLYGHSSTNSQRVTGVGYATSSEDGNIFSGAVQADTLLRMGTINLIPQAGLRIAAVSNGSFAESGVLPAFALTGNSGFYTSVQPFVNLDVSTVFLTASNVVVTPDASFGYAYEAGDIGRAVGVTAHDGTYFSSDDLKLDPSIGELSAGISAGKDWWSFYARYSAALTGNWTSQTGEAGLRIRF